MNIERIGEAKHAIANYISQIDAMRRAHTEIEVAISHFNAVHAPMPADADVAAFNNRHALRAMTDGLEMQIRVAKLRITNLQRVIDEEVNA